MATLRERPYSQFNFLVEIDGLARAGFQEVSGLGTEITTTEYREGNELENAPRKITGLYKVPDVTLKRGVIGSLDLFQWFSDVRKGSQEALRTVTISLLSEDRATTAMSWKLRNARPMNYTGPSFNGNANEIAVEELVLCCEGLDIE